MICLLSDFAVHLMPGQNARSKKEMVVCQVRGCNDWEKNQKSMKRCSSYETLKKRPAHPEENASDPIDFREKKQTVLSCKSGEGRGQQDLSREGGEGQWIVLKLSQEGSFM